MQENYGNLQFSFEREILLLRPESDFLVESYGFRWVVVVHAQHRFSHAFGLQGLKAMQHQPGSYACSPMRLLDPDGEDVPGLHLLLQVVFLVYANTDIAHALPIELEA